MYNAELLIIQQSCVQIFFLLLHIKIFNFFGKILTGIPHFLNIFGTNKCSSIGFLQDFDFLRVTTIA